MLSIRKSRFASIQDPRLDIQHIKWLNFQGNVENPDAWVICWKIIPYPEVAQYTLTTTTIPNFEGQGIQGVKLDFFFGDDEWNIVVSEYYR